MSERKHDQWAPAPPIRIDRVGEDGGPRPCDLVVCPECLAVRYIGGLQLEDRVKQEEALFQKEERVKGVFCPGCDQLLFDEDAWIEHRAEQRQYDNELKRKDGERAQRSGPLSVAAEAAASDEQQQAEDGKPRARRRARKEPVPA